MKEQAPRTLVPPRPSDRRPNLWMGLFIYHPHDSIIAQIDCTALPKISHIGFFSSFHGVGSQSLIGSISPFFISRNTQKNLRRAS